MALADPIQAILDAAAPAEGPLIIAAPSGPLQLSTAGGITVASHVAPYLQALLDAARADGVELDEAATLAILERVPAGMRSSMQKDAAAGRPIELDAIGGAVLRAAERAGTEAPVTARLVAELQARSG